MSDFSANDDKRLRELATVFRRAHRNGDRDGAARAARMFVDVLLDNGWKPPNWTGDREEALASGVKILLGGFDH